MTLTACACLLLASAAAAKDIDADERVIFFPTAAVRSEPGDAWVVPIHGWVFEPEYDSLWRNELIGALENEVLEDADAAERLRFISRARWFLVDNERGQRIEIRIGDHTFALPRSAANGHFRARLRVPAEVVDVANAQNGWLTYEAVMHTGDMRRYIGRAQLLASGGVSVISDIDDTIKISEVGDRRRLLRIAFLERYEAVPGMADVYRRWAQQGAAFHYVTATPWQLYHTYSTWMHEAGFPRGSFHMKLLRWKDESIDNLFADALAIKRPPIERLLEQYPDRRFILVGDDSDDDPALYAQLAHEYPNQVAHIFIRRTVADEADPPPTAMEALPSDMWTLFPDDITALWEYMLPEATPASPHGDLRSPAKR